MVLEIYKITNGFPEMEIYGLSQQMRRASVSIPCNIVEGYGRKYKKEHEQFLSIAYGPLLELETQYLSAADLKYLSKSEIAEKLLKEVGAMLYRMLNPVR